MPKNVQNTSLSQSKRKKKNKNKKIVVRTLTHPKVQSKLPNRVNVLINDGTSHIGAKPHLNRSKNKNRSNHGTLEMLSKHMSPASYKLLKFMISPGDNCMNTGLPDNNLTKSVPVTKIMDNVTFNRPSTFTKDTWSMIILTIPSPEIAALIYKFDGNLSSSEEILWNSFVEPSSHWDASFLRWSDTSSALSTKTDGTAGTFPLPEVGCPTAVGATPLVNSNFSAVISSNVGQFITSFRKLAGSVTSFLDATALTDSGVVYSLQYPSVIDFNEVNMSDPAYYYASATSSTAPVLGHDEAANFPARVWQLQQLPNTLSAFLNLEHYTGTARQGNYCVERWRSMPDYVQVDSSRGLLAISNQSGTSPLSFVSGKTLVPSPDRSATAELPAYLTCSLDPSRLPSCIAYTNLTKEGTITSKFVGAFECTVTQNGPLTFLSETPPSKDTVFIEIAEAVGNLLPPGDVASANDFFTTLKNVASTIWEVIKFAVPILAPLL